MLFLVPHCCIVLKTLNEQGLNEEREYIFCRYVAIIHYYLNCRVETIDYSLTVSLLQGEQGGSRGVRGLAGQGAGRPGEGSRHQRGRARQAGGRQAGAGAAAGGAPLAHQHSLGLQRWVIGIPSSHTSTKPVRLDSHGIMDRYKTYGSIVVFHNIKRLGETIK